MADFLPQQADFYLFLYGIIYMLLAAVCLLPPQEHSRIRLPWNILGLFAFLHGINEWMDLLAINISDNPVLYHFRSILFLVLSACFLEFGRNSFASVLGRAPGRWIIIPFFLFCLSGKLIDGQTSYVFARLAMILPGGLIASGILFSAYKKDMARRRSLILAAVTMAIYALFEGLIVPKTLFFPFSIINNESFFGLLGFSVRFCRGACVFALAIFVWRYSETIIRPEGRFTSFATPRIRLFLLLCLLVLASLGWIATETIGQKVQLTLNNHYLCHARIAALALPVQHIRECTCSSGNSGTDNCRQLRQDLEKILQTDSDFERVFLAKGENYHLVPWIEARRNMATDSQVMNQSIDIISSEPRNESRPEIFGPYVGSEARTITWCWPISGASETSVAIIGIDIAAAGYSSVVSLGRVIPIGLTGFLCMVILGFFVYKRNVDEFTEEIQASERMLSQIINVVPQTIFWKDRNSIYLGCNEKMARSFGVLSNAEVIGKSDYMLCVKQDEAKSFIADDREVMDNDRPKLNIIESLQVPGDSLRWLSTTKLPLHDENGAVMGVLGVFEDITDRRRAEEESMRAAGEIRRMNQELEDRVRERTAQLEFANSELESFSYSISHDLRAPLRAIDGFSHILIEDVGPKLTPNEQKSIERICANVSRMGQLIDDLLSFSRANRVTLNITEIAAADMVGGIIAEFEEERKARGVKVSIGALPACRGDFSLLRQVWLNLISNAFKFTGKRSDAIIEIGFNSENGVTEYFIKDNGAGFDMNYADKMFTVFQRLHSADEFPGTGAGLAIVKRIIRRHGGNIKAEGKMGEGAKFSFTLSS
ncbi:MAG: PAS domain-containing protein [Candidatus Riflebacteria bacterium]|nr:PAS domain-containing protein [Candidatus Riflebacteria bacterium]